jgi:phosphatidylglycerol---prolipoprotein diacylglyceryl transferase
MEFLNSFPIYFFVISAVVCGCFIWTYLRAAKWGFSQRDILDLSLFVSIIGFIGARLIHVVYEFPEYYKEEPSRIFDFGRGGYVYYGGLLFGILAGWLFLRFRNLKPQLKYFDFAAPVLSLGYALGRIACLCAGCCYGPVFDGPFGMSVTDENGILHRHHPTPLYSTLLELVIFGFLILLERKRDLRDRLHLNFNGGEFFAWLMLHSLARFILEFWRADYRGPEYIFSLSGWISLILFGVAITGLVYGKRRILK